MTVTGMQSPKAPSRQHEHLRRQMTKNARIPAAFVEDAQMSTFG
jgi:hypothetical protein